MTEKYPRDYWEQPSGQVFCTGGRRYGLTSSLRTICIGPENGDGALLDNSEPVINIPGDTLDTPQQIVTDNKCVICNNPVPGKRIDRHFCSVRCRKRASRGKQLVMAGIK